MKKKDDFIQNFESRFNKIKTYKQDDTKIYYHAFDNVKKINVFIKEYENSPNITYYLKKEIKLFKKIKNSELMIKCWWKGIIKKKTIFIYEKAGYDLKYIFKKLENNFSISTCSLIAKKILSLLEVLQKNEIIIYNLKPKSILISNNPKNFNLFISSFKFAIINNVNYEKYENEIQNKINSKYSSINCHLGVKPSHKDDIENLFYLIVYFLKKGKIFKINEEIKIFGKNNVNDFFLNKKLNIVAEKFCEDLPKEMYKFFVYIKNLNVNDKPNYKYLINLMDEMNIEDTKLFDWIIKGIYLKSKSNTKNNSNRTNSLKSFDSLNENEKNDIKEMGNLLNFNNNNIKIDEKKINRIINF